MTGTCNGVGFIAQYLGGGFGPLTPKLGMGVDNLVSARLLLASGEAMTASSAENQDVFNSVRGGGQILGIVSEIQVPTYPLVETLNATDGTVWNGSVMVPVDRAADVAAVLEKMKLTRDMAVYMLIASAMPEKKPPPPPMFIFSLSYFGSDEQADAAFADLYALKPKSPAKAGRRVPYAKMNDRNKPFQEVGGFKRFFGIGLQTLSGDRLAEAAGQLAELMAKAPDFGRACIFFEFLGMEKTRESSAGIYPHRAVNHWW